MSPYLPLTPDQIAEQAIEAAQAGAAILHLHARDPRDGRPTPDPAVFDQFVPRIRAATDAVINITTGGSTRMTLEERLAYPLRAQPEMCSLNMGSMNFSIHPVARKITAWQHDWEQPYVEGMEDLIFRNTFRDIKHILQRARRRLRHTLRVRVLRRRPPLQPGALRRRGAGAAGRCSSRASSASSAASGPTRRTWSRCAAPPTACSAATATASRCSAPAATRCRC